VGFAVEDGPDAPRLPLRFGRALAWMACGGVLVAAVAGFVAFSGGGRQQSPEDALRDIRRFVTAATSAHFAGTVVEHRESDGETEEFRSELEGDLAPGAGELRWRLDEDGWIREGLVAGSHFYQRGFPGEPGAAAGTQWAYYSANVARGQRVVGYSEPTFLRDAGAVAPFVSWLTPGELGGVIDLLQQPLRVDDDTIRASLGLAEILGDFTGGAGLRDIQGGLDIELTSGPDGRLEHLRWVIELRPRNGSDLGRDDRPYGPFEDYRLEADVRFSKWQEPAGIQAPPPALVDATPLMDEEALSEVDFVDIVAPRSLPDGFYLYLAGVVTPDGAEATGGCPAVHLGWGDIRTGPVYGPEGTTPPPSLDFELTPAGCGAEPEEDARVVELGGTRLVVRSALPDEFVDAAVSDLVPFSLAAQNVFRQEPPAASS
jgi:hypothetical protein